MLSVLIGLFIVGAVFLGLFTKDGRQVIGGIVGAILGIATVILVGALVVGGVFLLFNDDGKVVPSVPSVLNDSPAGTHGLVETFYDIGQLRGRQNYIDGELNGLWEMFYESNGQLRSRGNYRNGEQDGLWERFHENGHLFSRGNHIDGEQDGLWEYFYESNGQLRSRGNYRNGEQDGLWENFDTSVFGKELSSGRLASTETYRNGELVERNLNP